MRMRGRFSGNSFTDQQAAIVEFPARPPIMAPDRVACFVKKRGNRFAQHPLQIAVGVSGALVNLCPLCVQTRQLGGAGNGDRLGQMVISAIFVWR